MKKSQKKLLRKLLSAYRDALVKKPFTKGISQIVDCTTVVLEVLKK